ncbi:RNA polymerase sigma factor [Spirosoma validum]|uniref:Sigma-70 family RNA polymerase sigma factor n=1 Tax=Spirosoma validum TaxID=2771355 RepID=A0A927B819_9BACT|nr:sigma-70 family RNA polymerase sigma factor [Spirosoma validum]MBD2756988.1 sigma-70 family RNA polymerase sigma factor [Spirosoma validum]
MKKVTSDDELIRQHLTQQPNQCFEELYKKYVDKVYQRCLFMTKDAEQAQDFTQDVFIKVFGKLDDFQQRSSFSTWINVIAYNYCADQIRLAKRLPTTSIDERLEDSLGESGEARVQEESLDLARQALTSLPPQEQLLLRQKYEQGLSLEELARIHQLTLSAVKMRLKRSREKIQYYCAQQQTR